MIKALRYFVLFSFCIAGSTSFAQPSPNYFQQEVNYTIKVKLNDVKHELSGFETIEYINNSPHTLKQLYFHVWPNAYKNDKTALAKQLRENGALDFHFSAESERGFIDSLFFRVDGDSVGWKLDEKNIDICKVYLKKPLEPHDTIIITTPFHVKLPSGEFSRLGHIGQSYQITQWYPKPAVYDRNGWNEMPYLNQGEFYSEYGSFDVSITLPANYVVGATGDLYECPQEEKWLDEKYKTTKARFENNVNKIGNLIGTDDFPASSKEWKTLRYRQKNVHDFAWFADKRWNVLKGEYVLPRSGRLVTTWAMFTNGNSRYWKKSINYINDAVKYYSQWNGEYPYSQVTAVDGTISAGGGMEYPNVTVIGSISSDMSLETVIMHEVGHNWFYGILGSNEREHPWMDEGLNSFNEMRYIRTKYPELTIADQIEIMGPNMQRYLRLDQFKHKEQYYLLYLMSARANNDQPIETKAEDFTSMNYAAIVYMKTAAAFSYLCEYLGEDVFDKCMQKYYQEWKFKHPQPEDLRKIFESTAKKDLSWFFDQVIKTNKIIDYKIAKKAKPNTESRGTFGWMKYEEGVKVINKGEIIAPFVINGITNDTIADERWVMGYTGSAVVSFPNGKYDRIVIDPFWMMPDYNRRNNTLKYRWDRKVLFKHIEPLRFQLFGGIEDPTRTTIYFTPALGANVYDGVMVGAAFYNSVVPARPFEYTILPFFGTKSLSPAGSASLSYRFNFRKSKLINNIVLGTNAVYYSSYNKEISGTGYLNRFLRFDPYLSLELKKKKARSPHNHKFTVKYNNVTEFSEYNSDISSGSLTTGNIFYDFIYDYNNKNALRPWSLQLMSRTHEDFSLLMLEAKNKLLWNAKGDGLSIRFFAGAFFFNGSGNARYNLRMDGQRGFHDYTYHTTFIGRSETQGLWAQQFADVYGGFKAPTAYGQSDMWLSALNLSADLPIPFVKVFADAGIAPVRTVSSSEIEFLSDAGVFVSIFNNRLKVYFPFFVTNQIKDEYEINDVSFAERIRFTLDINNMNPLKYIRQIEF